MTDPLRYGLPNDIDATGHCCCNGCIGEGPCDLDLDTGRRRDDDDEEYGDRDCDAGLPTSCTHPSEDYRPVMLALVREIERFRLGHYYAEVRRLQEEVIPPLRAQLDAAVRLLAEFADAEKCWFDHHGYCQAHGSDQPCVMEQTRELLAAYRKAGA